ncbi:30S ribosomal protein S31, mitochondrial-like [Chenopodium quinoa]|uniref:30S ribosomal protein S31, mitochondrial n=1 Tax=Chenopodium quinoa TaxID=63459 RepID=A0A803LPF3_CHEQI|nr:30S ribosomal protein S31, mitochondrial-like [Chenopodium quinoa]XP_021753483.1 30S ribosomal protein S31, mitochondrial-like [Chenopodium quinoa]
MAMKQLCSSIARRIMSTHQIPASPISSYSSMASSSSIPEAIVCGRGDKKTKRGKRFKGSYGNSRPKKKDMIQRFKDKLEVPSNTPWPLPFKVI